MWDDGDAIDPDDEDARARVMRMLGAEDDADEVPLAPPELSSVAAAAAVAATPQSSQVSPPRLECSVSWGLMLLREASATHSAVDACASWDDLDVRKRLTVSVVWGKSTVQQRFRLSISRQGKVVTAAEADADSLLACTFSVHDSSPGEIFVARLRWSQGSCTLHCLAPLHRPVRLDGLLVPANPDAPLPLVDDILLDDEAETPAYRLFDRGVGLELEVLTLAPEPSVSGCFAKMDEIGVVLDRIAARDHSRVSALRLQRLHALLARCRLWKHETDDHVCYSSESIAQRAVDELRDETGMAVEASAADLHRGGSTTMKSEFKSPTPADGALNFARRGAEEVACFVRVLRCIGAGAPALSALGTSGGSLHVHVNVCNPNAGGNSLSCLEMLSVFFAWVRFDLVTAKFARPWMWREPSMAPLYATGAEFSWQEPAWQQGIVASASAAMYDVPHLLMVVRSLYADPGFAAASDEEQRERLFGRAATDPASPAAQIGRYCSLNLRRITSYGTLEFRRFHGTLDEAVVTRWAHFCVAFVECFRHHHHRCRSLVETLSEQEALTTIDDEQERATSQLLMEEMDGFVDSQTADFFLRDSGAWPAAG